MTARPHAPALHAQNMQAPGLQAATMPRCLAPGAPTEGGAATAPLTELAALTELQPTLCAEWDKLTATASEPNVFMARWFIEAAIAHLALPATARLLIVRERGRLIGLMPVHVVAHYGRIPVAHLENWLHVNAFYGAPLVQAGAEVTFWTSALALLDRSRGIPFVHLTALDEATPLTRALLAARRGTAIVHRSQRALLASPLGSTAYYETTVRKKKRKDIGRLRARLGEHGRLRARWLGPDDDCQGWIAAFLALEASGWKGCDGAALANDARTAAFTRAALAGAAAAGALEMVRLDLDDRPIAMLVNFLAAPGAFSWKIAFAEDVARYSPGVLITIEALRHLDRRDVDWIDSCAAPDHPMIDSLWGERRPLVRVTVPLAGWRRRVTFAACRALEDGYARAKRWR